MNFATCRILEKRPFVATAFAAVWLVSAFISRANADEPKIDWNAQSGKAVLTTGDVELIVETKDGINAKSLRDVKSGQAFADRDYQWPSGGFPKMSNPPEIKKLGDGSFSISFKGRLDAIDVEQVFTLPKNEPGVVLEEITIANPSDAAIETKDFKCGFTKCLREGESWTADATGVQFSPIPYRRETDGQMQVFPLKEVVQRGMIFRGWVEPPTTTVIWGSEGWVWNKGSASLLLAKYNAEGMEWSLMEPVKREKETLLRFGGAGQWKYGSPEGSTRLEPGKSFRFGETRYQAIDGDWKQAFYAFRGYVGTKGCRMPKDYNPPVHWNELYDNEYFFKVNDESVAKYAYTPEHNVVNKKVLAQYYSKNLIVAEASKAKEFGCEALYLDPGWDTGPSHHIWDEERLGSMESFVEKMKDEYGLKVSLWIGTGGMPPTYADPEACPIEARVADKDGRRTQIHCFDCPAFLDTKEKRLLELCRNGAAFMMFDSTQFSGPCYDKTHGHSIPSTREEHTQAVLELVRRVKEKYPKLLIELHDPVSGPGSNHYTPTYFGYARPHSWDCIWGHEFMWSSMDDLLSRRAVSLYYYNLAYNIPIYLHVGLKPDNENAIVFWWFASTCRHLGVGGKSPNPAVWEAQKKALQTYLPLKRYFTQGEFYGLDETVHAHALPELGEAVMNVFNLDDQPATKTIRFRAKDIGLAESELQIEGAEFKRQGDETVVELPIPARGHALLKVHEKKS